MGAGKTLRSSSVDQETSSWTVGRLLTLGFVLAVVTLLIIGSSGFVGIRSLIQEQTAASEAAQILAVIDATAAEITTAETGQRGYLLTGDETYLRPYVDSLSVIKSNITALGQLLAPDPRQRPLLDALQEPLSRKLGELAETIDLRRTEGFAAAESVVLSNRGAQDMTVIQQLFDQMHWEQDRLLQQRQARSATSAQSTQRIIVLGSLLGAVIVGSVATWITRKVLRPVLRITAAANRITAGDLSAQAPLDGPAELMTMARSVNGALEAVAELNDALRESEQRVLLLNGDLEQRVQRRTAELESSNRELDAFSYSVAHDLRTPLRALDGFSHLIEERYADQLGDTGQEWFRRIQVNALRMSELIDDLLRLSRTTRVELQWTQIDLTLMTNEINDELRGTQGVRSVEASVASHLTTAGDARLVRLMLNQLLANAWKFTSSRAEARIEVGQLRLDGRLTYFVRDNGVGFDSRYAAKLFQPFQRLHDPSQFSGTGIGLAIAERVTTRHGGRLWAESELGHGAVFFFTLAAADPVEVEMPLRADVVSGPDMPNVP